jgi:hypothetical protein
MKALAEMVLKITPRLEKGTAVIHRRSPRKGLTKADAAVDRRNRRIKR